MAAKIQLYLDDAGEKALLELERMWRIGNPKGSLSRDVAGLILAEAHKHRKWLDNIAEAAGPAQPVVRQRGMAKKEAR